MTQISEFDPFRGFEAFKVVAFVANSLTHTSFKLDISKFSDYSYLNSNNFRVYLRTDS